MQQILSDVKVVASASSSLDIKWTVNTLNAVSGFIVRHQHEGSQKIIKSQLLEPATTSYIIEDLDANTQYRVCVDVYSSNHTSPSAVCIDALTSSWHVPVSIGSSIGALLALVIIVIIVMVARFKGSKRTRKFKANGDVGKSFFSSTETEASRNFEMSEISIHADDDCSFYSENYEDDLNIGDLRFDTPGETSGSKPQAYYMQLNETAGNAERDMSITPVRTPRQVRWNFSNEDKSSQDFEPISEIGQGQTSMNGMGDCIALDVDSGDRISSNGPLTLGSLGQAERGQCNGQCQGHCQGHSSHTCELSPEVRCCTLGCTHSKAKSLVGCPNSNTFNNTEACQDHISNKSQEVQNPQCMCSLAMADIHVHRPGRVIPLTPTPILKKNNNNVDLGWTKRDTRQECDSNEGHETNGNLEYGNQKAKDVSNVAVDLRNKDLFRNISAPGCVEAASIQPICTNDNDT